MLHCPNSAAHFQLTGVVILLSAYRLARSHRDDAAAVGLRDHLAQHGCKAFLARISAQREALRPVRELELDRIGQRRGEEVELGLALGALHELDIIAGDLILLKKLSQRTSVAREWLGVVAAVLATDTEQPSYPHQSR